LAAWWRKTLAGFTALRADHSAGQWLEGVITLYGL